MKASVISDIHSNFQALGAVLAAAPRYDTVWNLGDVVGYGANPNEVVDVATQLDGLIVRGNHDRACSGTMDFRDFRNLSSAAASSAMWTKEILTSERTHWLSTLPSCLDSHPAWPGSSGGRID